MNTHIKMHSLFLSHTHTRLDVLEYVTQQDPQGRKTAKMDGIT